MHHTGMSGEPRCHTCGQPLGYWAIDWLTGLPDRWGWQDRAPHVAARASHAGEPLALLIIDVDRFKAINDSVGHTAGDMVLRAVSRVLQEVTSARDVLGRYGGDEFVALLPATDFDGALAVTGDIHRRVRDLSVGVPVQRAAPVTTLTNHSVSVGLATHDPDRGETPSLEDLFLDADAALLTAKRDGRGRTCAIASGSRHSSVPAVPHQIFDAPPQHLAMTSAGDAR